MNRSILISFVVFTVAIATVSIFALVTAIDAKRDADKSIEHDNDEPKSLTLEKVTVNEIFQVAGVKYPAGDGEINDALRTDGQGNITLQPDLFFLGSDFNPVTGTGTATSTVTFASEILQNANEAVWADFKVVFNANNEDVGTAFEPVIGVRADNLELKNVLVPNPNGKTIVEGTLILVRVDKTTANTFLRSTYRFGNTNHSFVRFAGVALWKYTTDPVYFDFSTQGKKYAVEILSMSLVKSTAANLS